MSYQDDLQVKFNNLPADLRNKIKNPAVDDILRSLEDKYQISLDFLVVLVMTGELALDDVPDYLAQKYQLDEEEALDIKDELFKAVFIRVLDEKENQGMTPEDKIKSIFQNHLSEFLNGSEEIKNELNQDIIYLIGTKEAINQEELAKIMLANGEILTTKPFLVNENPVMPTIANWLKDFIRYHGVEYFDNIVIVQYASTSPNAKILDEKERSLLMNTLHVFRNVRFFPLPQAGEVVNWEIFPLTKEGAPKMTMAAPRLRPSLMPSRPTVSASQMANWQEKLKSVEMENQALTDSLREMENNISAATGRQPEQIKNELMNNFQAGRREEFLACLFLLVKMGEWPTMMADDKLKIFFRQQVLALLQKQNSGFKIEKILSDFDQQPQSPIYGKILLKFFLNKALNGQASQSAYLASKLENVFAALGQKEYLGLAYFDLASQRYEWASVGMAEDGGIKME